jgi:hypothetical protein
MESSVTNGNPYLHEFVDLQGPEVAQELQITPVTKPVYILHHTGDGVRHQLFEICVN